ncbi:hypothetical protein GCM10018785_48050 [Streptomyces longispororuber]|uniref:Uncharacterized protein n=1 Tax=Streptomyces longispororuber TaxID=68230 RepID=A0A918ZWF5_9ACTN|nr:hypothetical protein GCM10018785_48050 [Streptomyces longispororuber]
MVLGRGSARAPARAYGGGATRVRVHGAGTAAVRVGTVRAPRGRARREVAGIEPGQRCQMRETLSPELSGLPFHQEI